MLEMLVRDAAKGQTTQDLLQVTIISASEKTFEVILMHPFTLVEGKNTSRRHGMG